MFEKLEEEDFITLAKTHSRIAVFQEFPADLMTPILALQAIRKEFQNITLLESAHIHPNMGRVSVIGFDPVAEMKAFGNKSALKSDGNISTGTRDPLSVVRDLQEKYKVGSIKPLGGFIGGLSGYFSFEAISYFEQAISFLNESQKMPDLFFQFHDKQILFDHESQKMIVSVVMARSENLAHDYELAFQRIKKIHQNLISFKEERTEQKEIYTEIHPEISDEEYGNKVTRAKEYIRVGDAFQIVPSRIFTAKIQQELPEIYRSLRFVSAAPYMFYIETSSFALIGASPEKLVSLRDRSLESIPLAGTRKRSHNQDEDERLANELMQDPKEDAEHMMLVDLARNDLGKIGEPGSVHVEKLKFVQRFSHVMHLASRVCATMIKGLDWIDAIAATLPAGTLSGAPKVRAVEIIQELEGKARGVYGGAICMVDHLGNLESAIAIRMATIQDSLATIQVGAGIVYDSDPISEAIETRQKAKGMLEAIQNTRGLS